MAPRIFLIATALVTLGIGFASSPAAAQAQVRLLRLGVVSNTEPLAAMERPTEGSVFAALRQGLRELGWVEGRNLEIHWRSAEQKYERRPALIEELTRLPVDVILVAGNFATEEARKITQKIPIVMASSYSPVENKLVASLARPGGNVTGVTNDVGRELQGKRLAMLKQVAPRVSRVAFLVPAYGKPETSLDFAAETFAAAKALGITMFHVRFEDAGQLERAVDEAVRQGADGLFFGEWSPFFPEPNRRAIHNLAEKRRLPAIYCISGSADTGGLMVYGPDFATNYRKAAGYIDRILKGARPGDLPIEQPGKLEFSLNLKAAKAIGLAISPSVLAQADRIIE